MAKQFDNTNTFTLWKNEDKRSEKAPDYSGTVNINGTEYKIAGWKKTTAGGKVLLSGRVTPPENQPEQQHQEDPF